jgi:hypothetical protein
MRASIYRDCLGADPQHLRNPALDRGRDFPAFAALAPGPAPEKHQQRRLARRMRADVNPADLLSRA